MPRSAFRGLCKIVHDPISSGNFPSIWRIELNASIFYHDHYKNTSAIPRRLSGAWTPVSVFRLFFCCCADFIHFIHLLINIVSLPNALGLAHLAIGQPLVVGETNQIGATGNLLEDCFAGRVGGYRLSMTAKVPVIAAPVVGNRGANRPSIVFDQSVFDQSRRCDQSPNNSSTAVFSSSSSSPVTLIICLSKSLNSSPSTMLYLPSLTVTG